jgi:hypothetical protein
MLIDGDTVVYQDGNVTPNDDGSTNGEVVVFTATKVAAAEWANDRPREYFASNDKSTCNASIWLRRTLQRVSIDSDRSDRNNDAVWQESDGDSWPFCGQLALYFDSPARELRIPMAPRYRRDQLVRFRQFVSQLLGDLS